MSGVFTETAHAGDHRKGVIGMSESTSEPATLPTDGWEVLLERYRHAAVEVLTRHLRTGSRCSACGQSWPCTAACAAEATLEL